MTIIEFLGSRPCLEEIEGFIIGLQYHNEHPDEFPGAIPYDDETMSEIKKYQDRLLTGHDVPGPTRLIRGWKYQQKRKPPKLKRKNHE